MNSSHSAKIQNGISLFFRASSKKLIYIIHRFVCGTSNLGDKRWKPSRRSFGQFFCHNVPWMFEMKQCRLEDFQVSK